ncbi:MAG TPA: hypothetical protein GX399_18405 [Xanthomonadaceae bacterium]|nr:hypothetical protein [Xanthomonadaceae bacterium]
MKRFQCACGAHLFFDNVSCLSCGREVGWCPGCQNMTALEPLPEGGYRCGHADCGAILLKCRNYAEEGVCNRMVPVGADQAAPALCDCCRYNAVIPDLSIDGHRQRWAELEAAKRRLFYTLDLLGLPRGGEAEGFEPPLSFSFMADALPDAGLWRGTGKGEKVYTGHAEGHITINIKETDAVERERLRTDLNESHRTLIGHFRHEIGHYYWEVLVRGRDEARCRPVFGDHDHPSYAEALERYYEQGAPADWRSNFISAYATMHPWEDFAETFAFYLDIASVQDTALHFGLGGGGYTDNLDDMLRSFSWVGLVVNEINRDMGLIDLVPEIITPAIRNKLDYLHALVRGGRRRAAR